MKCYRTPTELNEIAASQLKHILRNGKMTTGTGGRYPNGWGTYIQPKMLKSR